MRSTKEYSMIFVKKHLSETAFTKMETSFKKKRVQFHGLDMAYSRLTVGYILVN